MGADAPAGSPYGWAHFASVSVTNISHKLAPIIRRRALRGLSLFGLVPESIAVTHESPYGLLRLM